MGALTTYAYKLSPMFSHPGVARAPSAPNGYAYVYTSNLLYTFKPLNIQSLFRMFFVPPFIF